MITNRREFLKKLAHGTVGFFGASALLPRLSGGVETKTADRRPNILFAFADDWMWPHAGVYGDRCVKTPTFDRIAREGMLFNNAFCAAPSCSPSRSAVLTGQAPHRLEQGGNLWGWLPAKFRVYPDLLEKAGYYVGATGKLWSPGDNSLSGRGRNPAGDGVYKFWRKRKDGTRVQFKDDFMSPQDYAMNFKYFLEHDRQGKPFCFWFGATEPHRSYKKGIGLERGKKLEDVEVPPFLPDTPEIRSDILDYYVEVEHFDDQVGKMLRVLDDKGELDNTLVAVTGDNGMPFPRAKCTLYDSGVHAPLAIRWGSKVKHGSVCDYFVNLADMSPTFLEVAGLKPLPEMTAASLVGLLKGRTPKRGERDAVFSERERHTDCRPNHQSYPQRAIRTEDFLYIRNLRPHLWPAGGPPEFRDVDNSPSKTEILNRREEKEIAPFFRMAFAKRPEEELYDLSKDPWQLVNVADRREYASAKKKLRAKLDKWMADTSDPRALGEEDRWDRYPYCQGTYWRQKGRAEYLRRRETKQK